MKRKQPMTAAEFGRSPVFAAMVNAPDNRNEDGTVNWSFVDADFCAIFPGKSMAWFDAACDAFKAQA